MVFFWNAGDGFPGIVEPECRVVWGLLSLWRKCRLRMRPVLKSRALADEES